jgi:protein-S-isoprenylcysteine O-methyltransferase Ste14
MQKGPGEAAPDAAADAGMAGRRPGARNRDRAEEGLLVAGLNVLVMMLLVLFYLLFLGRSLLLIGQGVNPWMLGKGKRRLRQAVELLFLVGLVYWTFENFNAALGYRWPVLPELFYRPLFTSHALAGAGCLAMLLGLFLFSWALFSFGASWRIGIDRHSPGRLVTGGIFGTTRNPVFVAVDLFFLGSLLIYANLFFLLIFVLAALGIHYQILQEERFLLEQYGEAYARYQKQVHRYF